LFASLGVPPCGILVVITTSNRKIEEKNDLGDLGVAFWWGVGYNIKLKIY
jgi:hypothetical protein